MKITFCSIRLYRT